MWATESTELTKRTHLGKIWAKWADVDTWTSWDQDIEWVKLEGPLEKGASGKLKSKGGPATSFTVLDAIPGSRFTTRSFLPFSSMDFIHTLSPEGDHLRITHRIEIKGPLAFLFSRLLGPHLKKGLPATVCELVQQVEKSN